MENIPTKLLQVDVPEDLIRAVDIEKAKRGTSRADVICRLIRANLEPAPPLEGEAA